MTGRVGTRAKAPWGKRFRKGFKQWMDVLPFIGVGMILFFAFVLYPQIKNLFIAVTDYSIMPNAENPFIGLESFRRIFTDVTKKGTDGYFFWLAFRNNVLAVLVTVPGQMIIGLLLAVMINAITRGKTVFKVIFYIAVICDWIVVANIFTYIFQGDRGALINYILLKIGIIAKPVPWLAETWTGNAVIWIFCIFLPF